MNSKPWQYTSELYHYGTPRHSGRFPWGSGDRPYQSMGGAATASKILSREEYEANKARALKSGSADDILKYKGDLTNNEMQTAVTRLNLERQLESISSQSKRKGERRTSQLMSVIGNKVLVPLGIGAASVAARYAFDSFAKKAIAEWLNVPVDRISPATIEMLKDIKKELFKGVNVVNKK